MAYVADADLNDLQIIDVSNPAAPVLLGSIDTPGFAYGVSVVGGVAYVACWGDGLQIVDVNDPAAPVLLGSHDTPYQAVRVTIAGSVAYVSDNANVEIIDVSDPAAPALLGVFVVPGGYYAKSVTLVGERAYVAAAGGGLHIVDISDPAAPALLGSYDTANAAMSVSVVGDVAYVAESQSGLQIIDVSDFRPCPPDLDHSCTLDLFDFLAFTNLFNAHDPKADCAADGAFDLFDFLCFVNAFNEGC